jgi:hypothetical protein
MRKSSPALVVTSLVLALAASTAFAQRLAAPQAGGSASTSTATSGPALIRANAAATGSTAASVNRTPSGSTNISTATSGAVAANAASLGNPTVLTNADGSKSSTTLNADGSRTIVTMNLDGSSTVQNLPANLVNPAVINGTIGTVTVDGERLLDERDQALQINRSAAAVEVQTLGAASLDVQRSAVSLDRVIKTAEKDRKKIGRNGQLLNTIAPRTNADRSNEMPDDGPTPALSGLANSLSRR